ncbi:response regulator [Dyadobacter luteus]|jgi:CheY-like chemotaxis protein|uniref:Response regulator n=1 Tax=Dyadobacter luteus TaxID=2259619 RepID=A0A3D8Y2C8_9BACT|nr:response regulator [Dyadobacter luteus]REA55431.1 response regulator [Dyadobacter luteus]
MEQNAPVHILLADDDDDDTSLFQEALEQVPTNTRLDVAENGMELMSILERLKAKPDLIFLDMNMPVKNGMECLTEIRNSSSYKDIPVVILSTSIADYLIQSAYQAGANLYIQKPNSFSGLISIIKKCLSEKEKLRVSVPLEQFLIK